MSCSGQCSTVQGSSPHKCNQEVWWDVLNVGVATIPSVMSWLTPSPKFFLNSRISSGNVPLMRSYCSSMWPPQPWIRRVAQIPYLNSCAPQLCFLLKFDNFNVGWWEFWVWLFLIEDFLLLLLYFFFFFSFYTCKWIFKYKPKHCKRKIFSVKYFTFENILHQNKWSVSYKALFSSTKKKKKSYKALDQLFTSN